jgi:hypothetical protein
VGGIFATPSTLLNKHFKDQLFAAETNKPHIKKCGVCWYFFINNSAID